VADLSPIARGEAMAAILAGAWLPSPPPLQLKPEMLEAVHVSLATGGAGGGLAQVAPDRPADLLG